LWVFDMESLSRPRKIRPGFASALTRPGCIGRRWPSAVWFGRIGSQGQSQTKAFVSPAAAQSDADRLIVEKLRKGYRESTTGPLNGAFAGVPQDSPVPKSVWALKIGTF
jgi:hypothetical protein